MLLQQTFTGKARRYAMLLCVCAAVALLVNAFYIELKAQLAQWLISHSWDSASEQQLPEHPWPWADTRPVAKLEVPGLGVVRYVMQSASGESLAFGPGQLVQGVLPGNTGHALIAGHRDTHFAFLRDLQVGDVVHVANYRQQSQRFVIEKAEIIDSSKQSLLLQPDDNLLTLITCYPFDAIDPNGPLRYIVTARPG